jgi:hypothetical protein
MTSILVAAVAMFIFGALWFTVLFGKTWAKLMDFNPAGDEEAKKMGMTKPLIMNFLLNVVVASVVAYLYPQFLSDSYSSFLKTLLIIWLGFSFPIFANAAVWERKSWKLVVINSVQGIGAVIIASAIVYFM